MWHYCGEGYEWKHCFHRYFPVILFVTERACFFGETLCFTRNLNDYHAFTSKMEDICNISINNKNKVKDKRNAGATAWFSGKIPNHATSHRMVHEKISEPRDSASYGSAEIDAQKK
jgi:hypothetical protein